MKFLNKFFVLGLDFRNRGFRCTVQHLVVSVCILKVGPFQVVILIIGDDNVFRTPGWDDTVKEIFAKFPDGICLVYGNDLNQGRNMCTAPFLSRKYCEILGGPCPAEYTGEFVDTHIMDTFYKLRYWGYDRIVYLKDLIIEHMHHVVGKAPLDDTYANKAPTEDNRNLFFELDPLRVEQARALVRYLSNGHKS